MKTAYLQLHSGISGDMCLGAFMDAGVSISALRGELKKLGLTGYTLKAEEAVRGGFRGTRATVKLKGKDAPARKLSRVRSIIKGSTLSSNVKKRGLDMFQRIFEAEARVHGTTAGRVHLHELAATDALVDIMGAAICMDILGIVRLHCSGVNLGTGTVETAHGTLPVPAPATAELLKGIPVFARGEGELTTPTGAVIVSTLCEGYGPMPPMTIEAIGVGVGQRKGTPELPNLIRLFIGQATQTATEAGGVRIIETNIDDMSPEIYEHVTGLLFEQGALDVWITPVIMKKSRPAAVLGTMCTEDCAHEVMETILRETTTLGLRHYSAGRVALERRTRRVNTPYGTLRVKDAFMGDKLLRSVPEYGDAARAARKHKAALLDVMDAARRAAFKKSSP